MAPESKINIDQAKSVVILTALLVMCVTWAVGATGWTKGLNILTFVGLGVILIGMLLARSLLPGYVAHLFSMVIGVSWSFWVTSRLLPAHYTWLERWYNLTYRLNYWYSQARQGGTSYDNLMFIMQMAVILWAMGYVTIWLIFRAGKVWPAIIPGGVILLINLYYAPQDITWWFWFYLLLCLVLVIRVNLLTQEARWRAEGVFFRPDVNFDFLRDGLIFSVLVVTLSSLAPAVNAKSELLENFEGSWQEIQGEWNRLFADLNYRDVKTVGTFGQSLALGGPRQLTDEPVMDVQVSGIGRYWRAATYNEYTGEGWRSADQETVSFGPGGPPISLPRFEARLPVTQTYSFYRDGITVLYAMGNPTRLDRSAKAHFNALSGADVLQTSSLNWLNVGEPWIEEITYIRSNASVDTGESYQVVSDTSAATVSQLKNAGEDYPPWITARYLNLPDSTTTRTRQLAAELAAPYTNPYDQASAIERFVRAEIKYNEKIPAPPAGVDKVDYILFTAKEGYCDYYASSMIVMLRSLGIPARLAAGFARGTYNSDTNAFHVINANAHSWVEVYFSRYGWIEFEPTASQPAIIRPTGDEGSLFAGGAPNQGQPDRPDRPENIPIDDEAMGTGGLPFGFSLPWGGRVNMNLSPGVLAVGSAALLALAGLGLWSRRQLSKPVDNIAALYRQMERLAGWMGVPHRPWHTPFEHAAMLQRSLPARRRDIETITGEYVQHTFRRPGVAPGVSSVDSGQFAAIPESNLAWSRLRADMLRQAVKRRLPRRLRGNG